MFLNILINAFSFKITSSNGALSIFYKTHLKREISLNYRAVKAFLLTELIKVRFHAVGSGYRADEPGLQEGAPLVDQTAVTSIVVLFERGKHSFSISSSLILFPANTSTHALQSAYWFLQGWGGGVSKS